MEVVNSSIIRVSMLAPFRGTQAAALGAAGTFFPTTFLGWLVLFTVIVILIYVSRKLYKEREEEKKRKQKEQMAHHPELKISK
jgi:membrane protein implicated in regulation of membrane protease activity